MNNKISALSLLYFIGFFFLPLEAIGRFGVGVDIVEPIGFPVNEEEVIRRSNGTDEVIEREVVVPQESLWIGGGPWMGPRFGWHGGRRGRW